VKLIKLIGLALLVILVGIQFIPTRYNRSTTVQLTDFVITNKVPDDVQQILFVSCYNCHSNNTNYPWYSYVQPIGFLLENHISKAKSELNFSEFGSYSGRKQKSKLKSIISQIEKEKMPLASYTFIHRDAWLSQDQKKALVNYLDSILDSLQ
jgi:hypothetical protein